jgi:hypothetical protein
MQWVPNNNLFPPINIIGARPPIPFPNRLPPVAQYQVATFLGPAHTGDWHGGVDEINARHAVHGWKGPSGDTTIFTGYPPGHPNFRPGPNYGEFM